MNAKKASSRPVTSEQLQSFRKVTEKVSEYLRTQTETYLNALKPALIPHRLLGQHIEHPGKGTVKGADAVWNRLTAAYRNVAVHYRKEAPHPFSLPEDLETPLKPINPDIALYPWEYKYTVSAGKEREDITVTCPAKWMVSYQSHFNNSQFRHALESDPAREKTRIQEFVVNAMVMGELLRSVPGIRELFAALRLTLDEEKTDETGALPFATLTSGVASRLPDDEIVLQTTRLAGVPRFTELIDGHGVKNLVDPLRDQLVSLINSEATHDESG